MMRLFKNQANSENDKKTPQKYKNIYQNLLKSKYQLDKVTPNTNTSNFKGGGKSIYSDRTLQYIKDIIDILIKEHSPGTNKSKKDIKDMQYKAKEV